MKFAVSCCVVIVSSSITRLDHLNQKTGVSSHNDGCNAQSCRDMGHAARQAGKPTAGDKNIDGDVILAAQALSLNVSEYVIATTNVGHIGRYAKAQEWRTIQASS